MSGDLDEFGGLTTRMTKLVKQRFNDVACLLVLRAQGNMPRRCDEIPLFIIHNENHEADGTIFVMFNGELQCTIHVGYGDRF